MLKISRPVTEWQEFNLSLMSFKGMVKEIRWFNDRDEPDLQLYRISYENAHHVTGFVSVPASILPGTPTRDCDWDDYAREHLDVIYNYLVEKGEVL